MRQPINALLCVALLLASLSCGHAAWLYNSGQAHHAGLTMKPESAVTWAAASFEVAQESVATSIGAAIGRAAGPAGAGFNVYLVPTLQDPINLALAAAVLTPTSTTVDYYDALIQPTPLRPNQTYYLLFATTHPDFWGMISYTYAGTLGQGSSNLQDWAPLPYPLCIRVAGAPVPEPASLVSVVVGLVWTALRRRPARA